MEFSILYSSAMYVDVSKWKRQERIYPLCHIELPHDKINAYVYCI
jgi:hypothetical protein